LGKSRRGKKYQYLKLHESKIATFMVNQMKVISSLTAGIKPNFQDAAGIFAMPAANHLTPTKDQYIIASGLRDRRSTTLAI